MEVKLCDPEYEDFKQHQGEIIDAQIEAHEHEYEEMDDCDLDLRDC